MATKKVTQKPTDEEIVADQIVEEKTKYRVRANLDPNMIVTVKNGFPGTLVYISKKTGECFVWEDFGDEQDLELSELKSARNSSKKFYTSNWFLIDDPAVLDYLGVAEYYKYASQNSGFEKLFEKTPNEIKKDCATLTSGQKRTAAYRARQLISEGKIDSVKKISALEEALGVTLIER